MSGSGRERPIDGKIARSVAGLAGLELDSADASDLVAELSGVLDLFDELRGLEPLARFESPGWGSSLRDDVPWSSPGADELLGSGDRSPNNEFRVPRIIDPT